MNFHLNYIPPKSNFNLDHKSRIFLSGSCFSDHIGNLLKAFKFNALQNPGGLLFNPASIAASLQNVITQESLKEEFIVERDGLFFSYLHHSLINGETKKELTEKINLLNNTAGKFLKGAEILVITFGSAFIYRHTTLNRTVANCHKQPGTVFQKKMLTVEQVVKNYSVLIQQLQLFNPALRIIFTVSPVKYLRDGVQENNLSKSVLLLSVHELVKRFNNCSYFPAYELVNDDLRDYRFYKEDMAHPNDQAIDYVWDKFSECFFNDKTKELNQKIQKLNLALQHRTINNGSDEKRKFEEFILKQKEEIAKINPGIQFS
ncbi:MAG: GSCFA domain-containing protein [Bacteroidetes bacterium]|nr:GSCFA domain-containing protein [Bacteroidota bacterium]